MGSIWGHFGPATALGKGNVEESPEPRPGAHFYWMRCIDILPRLFTICWGQASFYLA